jgi:hypothetical protein
LDPIKQPIFFDVASLPNDHGMWNHSEDQSSTEEGSSAMCVLDQVSSSLSKKHQWPLGGWGKSFS